MRGDNADSFTEFHKIAGSEVATVTHRAYAPAALACEDRPDFELLDTNALQVSRDPLVDVLICLDNFFLFIQRVGDGFTAHAPDDALAKVDHFFVALINRPHENPVDRAAIVVGDDHVLRRIH